MTSFFAGSHARCCWILSMSNRALSPDLLEILHGNQYRQAPASTACISIWSHLSNLAGPPRWAVISGRAYLSIIPLLSGKFSAVVSPADIQANSVTPAGRPGTTPPPPPPPPGCLPGAPGRPRRTPCPALPQVDGASGLPRCGCGGMETGAGGVAVGGGAAAVSREEPANRRPGQKKNRKTSQERPARQSSSWGGGG